MPLLRIILVQAPFMLQFIIRAPLEEQKLIPEFSKAFKGFCVTIGYQERHEAYLGQDKLFFSQK